MHTAKTVAQLLGGLTDAQQAEIVSQLSDEEVLLLRRSTEGLRDFIPRVSPQYTTPWHLAPVLNAIEAARDQELQMVVHAPPRHTKTDTFLHGIAWHLEQDSTKTHGYATYSVDLARSKSRRARNIARSARVGLAADEAPERGAPKLYVADSLDEWRTPEGGGFLAAGVGGRLGGMGVTGMLVVDDAVKNRVEAESATYREKTWEWFNDVAYTRLEPGASCIVIGTRWHPDDLSGRLIGMGWKYLKLEAVNGEGKALWPERFPVDRLAKIREQVGEYTWASLYQGEPRARGGAVFGDVHLYDELPNLAGYRVGIGVDCAYTAKKSSHYSVAVTLVEIGKVYYVVDVQRMQVAVPVFKARLDAVRALRPGAKTLWYTSSTESGLAEMLGIRPKLAKEDKFVRAQPVAAAWNAKPGKILVPRNAPWADAFVSEVVSFTGVNDAHDDQVDALAAAYDALATSEFSGDLDKYPTHKPRY